MSDLASITAEQLLEQWLAHSGADDRAPIVLGEQSYRHFWSTWQQFLEGEDLPRPSIQWQDVTAVDVDNFLSNGVRERKTDAGVSEITKRRYWRLLDRIYSFAVDNGWIESNPAAALAVNPVSENPIGAVMTLSVWTQAMKALDIVEEDAAPLDLRNRALLLVLFELGLTPAEVRGLTLDRLTLCDPWTGKGGYLEVDGEDVNWPRKLPLQGKLLSALHEWVSVRARTVGHCKGDVLFSSRRGGAMTDENLLVLVRKHLIAAAAAAGQPPPPRLGPQIIRNSRLVFWLHDGVPVPEVVKRAGLKNAKSLFHLVGHLPEEIRAQIRNDRDDASPLDLPKPSVPGVFVKQRTLFADEAA